MQICRYSRRVVPIGFGSSVYVPAPCSTGIQESWQSVCFTRYSQWNAPSQHPYRPDATLDGINKLMKRVSLIAVIRVCTHGLVRMSLYIQICTKEAAE